MPDKSKIFICDTMLGKLARWLRILGYDTLYKNMYENLEIIELALKEDRILLTRDKSLLKILPKSIYFLENELPKKQLGDIVKKFSLDIEPKLEFCPVCNGKIIKVQKKSIESDVAEYTYRTHEEFYRCSKCSKVYWKGSHSNLAKDFFAKFE